MHFHVHVHHHPDPAIESKLDRIITMLQKLVTEEIKMSAELDALTAEVARDTAIESSAVKLINGIASQIQANASDPGKLNTLAASLKSSSDDLAAAVAANTPAAPPAPSPTGA